MFSSVDILMVMVIERSYAIDIHRPCATGAGVFNPFVDTGGLQKNMKKEPWFSGVSSNTI